MVFLNVNCDPFYFYKFFLRINGLWPEDRGKKGPVIIFTVFATFVVLTILKHLFGVLGMCSAYKSDGKDLTIIPWCISLLIVKSILLTSGSKMIDLIQFTIEDWSSISNPEEREIMKRHDKFGSLALQVVPILFYVGNIAHEVLQDLPYFDKIPLELDATICFTNEKDTWIILHVFTVAVWLVDSLSMHFGTLLFWSFAMHISSQYKILKKRFQEFLLIKDKKESRREFRHLVDRHNELFEISANLENAFGAFGGLTIVTNQIILCFLACELGHAIKAKELVKILLILRNAVQALYKLTIYYFAGDYLTASCEEVGEVFEQCNWYELSKESRTNFSIVIARSRRPAILTLWKLQTLNLSNLKYTINAVYSYVSLIVGVSME